MKIFIGVILIYITLLGNSNFDNGLKAYMKQDYEKAEEFYKKAAEQGDSRAQYYFAMHTFNDKKAIEWYVKAANQGHAKAQMKLAQIYGKGKGVEQDIQKAVKWLRKAAKQGYAEAQDKLGNIYYKGDYSFPSYKIGSDYKKAAEWYTKASNQDYSNAKYPLGKMYYMGKGVSKDYEKALKLFKEAIALNEYNAEAMYGLGNMYEKGKGVSQDYNKAIEWYTKAATNYNQNANKRLEALKEKYIEYIIKYGSNRNLLGIEMPMPNKDTLFNINTDAMIADAEIGAVADYVSKGMKGNDTDAKVFANYCALCHGVDGKGIDYMAPNIANLNVKHMGKVLNHYMIK